MTNKEAIRQFVKTLRPGTTFGSHSLTDWCRSATGRQVLDGSVTKDLRRLRASREVIYRVADRNRSLYELLEVRG